MIWRLSEEDIVEGHNRGVLGGRSLRGFAIGFVAVVVVGLVVLNLRGATKTERANLNDARQVALGQLVYSVRCASCHGANLEGQPNWQEGPLNGPRPAPPHDATGHTWHHSDALLFDIIKRGGLASSLPEYQNAMPAFGGVLSDDEIWAVLAYIKSSWPPDIRAAQEQVNQQGR
jgi:mono/diheme cytochrome c family protein